MDTIFGRWELAVAYNVYIGNESGSNIGAQTYNTYQYMFVLNDYSFLGT
jgi:hypothetical protein